MKARQSLKLIHVNNVNKTTFRHYMSNMINKFFSNGAAK